MARGNDAHGLKGKTGLGKGQILGEDMCATVPSNPLIPRRFKNVPITLASQEEFQDWIEAERVS